MSPLTEVRTVVGPGNGPETFEIRLIDKDRRCPVRAHERGGYTKSCLLVK